MSDDMCRFDHRTSTNSWYYVNLLLLSGRIARMVRMHLTCVSMHIILYPIIKKKKKSQCRHKIRVYCVYYYFINIIIVPVVTEKNPVTNVPLRNTNKNKTKITK